MEQKILDALKKETDNTIDIDGYDDNTSHKDKE